MLAIDCSNNILGKFLYMAHLNAYENTASSMMERSAQIIIEKSCRINSNF